MKTVVVDPGHGGEDSGAIYSDRLEKDLNLKLAQDVHHALLQKYRVKVLMTRTTDTFVSPNQRTAFANRQNADYFCSIHHNAGGRNGFESYIYNGRVTAQSKQAQDIIHSTIMNELSEYGLTNRGQRQGDFQTLRETRMPAILLNMLYIDGEKDEKLLKNKGFRKDAAVAVARGIAEALNLPPAEKTLYVVIAGSFKMKENARDRVSFLKQQQIDPFIEEAIISGDTYYRVQAGAFLRRENAEGRIKELKKMGIAEPFIITCSSPVENGKTTGPNICGKLRVKADDMDQFARLLNPDAPGLGKFYAEFGKHYGIRGDIAFAQALHETNDFCFTGSVHPEQNNYCGLGVTAPNAEGASFSAPRIGVLAHIQHLYGYATAKPLPEGYPLVDPYFDTIPRGSATTWTALDGKWAVQGTPYGQSILHKYENMRQYTIKHASSGFSLKKWLRKLPARIRQWFGKS